MLNLHRKLLGEVPMTYNGITAGTAALISSGIGLAGSVYSASKQRDAEKKAEAARLEAEREQERMFEATQPLEEEAKITFGVEDDDEELGTYNEFLAPKPTTPTMGTGSLGFGTLGGA